MLFLITFVAHSLLIIFNNINNQMMLHLLNKLFVDKLALIKVDNN